MTATLQSEIAKLSPEQKLDLIDQLWADLELSGPPAGILSEDDPKLEAILEQRLAESQAHPEKWLTLEQFKASFGDK